MGTHHGVTPEDRARSVEIAVVKDDALYIIRTFSRDTDARLAEAVLDANGIDSIVVADNAAGWLTYLDSLHPIRLAVKESDVVAEIALLDYFTT